MWCEFLLFQVLWTCLIAFFIGHCLINLWCFMQPKVSQSENSGQDCPVSVLVPARNESRNIQACLDSLTAQKKGIKEIIVLDDGSTDGTGEMVQAMMSQDSRLRLITGQELPGGWTGKCWACHQLAEAATGDYLLFTDADTIHEPDSIFRAWNTMEERKMDLLSLWPRQITETVAEKLIIPFMEIMLLVFFPHWMPGHTSILGAACGQFVMFRKGSYEKLGGHQSVKSHMVEDIALARRARSTAMRVGNHDGRGHLSCRMYQNYGEIVEGFSKNLRTSCDDQFIVFLGLHGSLHLYFLLPLFQVPLIPFLPVEFGIIVGLQVVLIFLMRMVLMIARGHHLISVILHPVGQLLWLRIAWNSWLETKRGKLRWKGRHYPPTADS